MGKQTKGVVEVKELLVKSKESVTITDVKTKHSVTVTEDTQLSLPDGFVKITLHKARDLQKKSKSKKKSKGKSDPYAIIHAGNQKYTSPTVKNNNSPEWNYDIQIDLTKQTNKDINIEVYDEDFGKDDLLGTTSLDLITIIKERQMTNKWIALENCNSGEVLFSAEFIPATTKRTSPPKEAAKELTPVKDVVQTPTVKPERAIPLPKGTIMVTLHKARELEKKGKFGKADPYAVLNVGKEKFKSKTINNNHNPEWNFDIKFDIDNETAHEISLEVYDEDMIGKDDPLGKTKLHLSQIVNQRKIINNWIPLQQCKSGEVLFSAEFVPFVAHEGKPEVAKKETSRPASPTKNVSKEKTPVKDVVPTPAVKPEKTVPLPKGTITVILHKARELEKKGKFGKADPYAVLNVGKEKFKSKTVNNNHNPEWNFDIKFDIDN